MAVPSVHQRRTVSSICRTARMGISEEESVVANSCPVSETRFPPKYIFVAQRKIHERRVNLFPLVGIKEGNGMEIREKRGKEGGERERKVQWKCKEGVRLSKSVVFGPNKNRENRKLSSSRGRQTFSLGTSFSFPFSFQSNARAARRIIDIRSWL